MRPCRLLAMLLLPVLAACAPGSVPSGAAAAEPDPHGEWFIGDADGRPGAAWGVRGGEPVLAFACDARAGRVQLQFAAERVPAAVASLGFVAGGLRFSLPARRVAAALGDHLEATLALDDPRLQQVLAASTLAVTAGTEMVTTTAPLAAIAPVVDACRRAVRPR
jgi:hypothetical protein